MLEFVTLIGIAFVGPVVSPFFPPLSTEAMAVFYGGQLGMHPLWVGLACAIGQCGAYTVLHSAGWAMVSRWPRLHRQIDLLRVRYTRARSTFQLATCSAAFFGLPPVLPMAVLARSFSMSLGRLVAICAPLRFARFAILAWIGDRFWPTLTAFWERLVG